MINTQLKFEAEIPNGSKVVAFTKNYIKFLSLKTNLTLKFKVKVTSFLTHLRYLNDQQSVKVQSFCVIRDLMMINTQLKFEASKTCCIHKESHKFSSFKGNLALKVKVKVTSFQTDLRQLNARYTVQVGR